MVRMAVEGRIQYSRVRLDHCVTDFSGFCETRSGESLPRSLENTTRAHIVWRVSMGMQIPRRLWSGCSTISRYYGKISPEFNKRSRRYDAFRSGRRTFFVKQFHGSSFVINPRVDSSAMVLNDSRNFFSMGVSLGAYNHIS